MESHKTPWFQTTNQMIIYHYIIIIITVLPLLPFLPLLPLLPLLPYYHDYLHIKPIHDGYYHGDYPLVNVYKNMEKITIFNG